MLEKLILAITITLLAKLFAPSGTPNALPTSLVNSDLPGAASTWISQR